MAITNDRPSLLRSFLMIPVPISEHMLYIQTAGPIIEANYLRALDRDASTEPAVLLLDLLDETARSIAETIGSPRTIALLHQAAERENVRPVVAWGLPASQVRGLIAAEFPEVAAILAIPSDPVGYWVVIVSEGSASAVVMPPVEPAPSRRSIAPSAN
jgi:hypothetical protein